MVRAWPIVNHMADFTVGPPSTPNTSPVGLDGGLTAVRSLSTSRGRQYELNKCESGTASYDIVDGSELLNPVNTGSPWNSGGNSLLPYRAIQSGAWWNTTTNSTAGNLLNATNTVPGSATPYDPSFETGLGGWFHSVGSTTLVQSTTQAFVGTHSMAATFTGATDNALVAVMQAANITHTLSLYLFVPASHTVTVTWRNYPGALGSTIATATTSTTAAWQRIVLTGVPQVPFSIIQLTGTGTYPFTAYVDAVQQEIGSSASAFTTSGPTYFPLYTGYVERYPQKWDMAGFRGVKPLEAVDALSPLSRATINQSYAQTVLADGPTVYIPYNDDAGPQTVQRPFGGQPFTGYTQLGAQSASVNFGGDTFLDGSKAVTVVQQNTDPVTSQDVSSNLWTYLGTRQGGVSMNPKSFSIECWVKWSSGVVYFGAGAMQVGESTVNDVVGTNNGISWYTSGGQLLPEYIDPNGNTSHGFGASLASSAWNGWPDGRWHHLVIEMSGTTTISAYVDGIFAASYAPTGPWSPAVFLNNFYIESMTYFGDPVSEIAVANMAAYTRLLTSTQISSHYSRGIGFLGELPGNRALRLLTKYWTAAVVTDPGKTPLSADFYYDPPAPAGQASQAKSVLSALEDIADTEMGLVWVDAAGKVHFDSRDTRYLGQQSAQFVFGENAAGGELPYLDIEYDYDPTYVYSEADLTCDNTGNTVTSVNATSQTNYGQRILSKTMYAQNDWDVQQAANFYTQRYAKPAGAAGTGVPPRISTFAIDPASNPKLFTAALSLDIGERVTVKRRTTAVTITGDYYIEQINHQINAEASSWIVQYQLSPVFVPSVWILGDSVKGVLGTTTYPVY